MMKLSADDVKKLPAGTRVLLHGQCRRGQTVERYQIAKSGKKKILVCLDVCGNLQTKQIRDYPNKWYEAEI